ncbi:MAG: hypothetical protein NUW37_14215 [Planctomycetes bacterium]|nr:hypothetical protein [Planctomycetota bacterium]
MSGKPISKIVLTSICLFAVAMSPVFAASADIDSLISSYVGAEDGQGRAEARQAFDAAEISAADVIEHLKDRSAERRPTTGTYDVVLEGENLSTYIWVPENYDSSKSYPLMIGLHGMGGKGDQIRNPAIPICEESGQLLICPSVEGGDFASALLRMQTDGFGWGEAPDNLAIKSLNYMKEHYNIDTNRVTLLGVSMGGYGTWSIGTVYPHFWNALTPYAGGISPLENHAAITRTRDARRRKLLENLLNLPVLFIHGTQDFVVQPQGDRWNNEDLDHLGYEHTYIEEPNWAHVDPPSRDEVPGLVGDFVAYGLERRRKPWPTEVVYNSLRQDSTQAYWVTLLDHTPDAKIHVQAERNVIDIESTNVYEVGVFLNSEIVNLRRDVTIRANGREVYKGKPELPLDAALESWRIFRDKAYLPEAYVKVAIERRPPGTTRQDSATTPGNSSDSGSQPNRRLPPSRR